MKINRTEQLLCALTEEGFYRSGERWIAPNGTLWISRPMLELLDASVLRGEAIRRLNRKLRQRRTYESTHDWQSAVEDAQCLVAATDRVQSPDAEEPLREVG